MKKTENNLIFDSALLTEAIKNSFWKLHPKTQLKNPVMFVVYVGAILTTSLYIRSLLIDQGERPLFVISVAIWLWFTILFANFAESFAEGRGKAQASSLRQARRNIKAKLLTEAKYNSEFALVEHTILKKGDLVLVEAGEIIPSDGEVVSGIATVDESAITGESAPVIRESGGDFSSVTGGTKVLSDWIIIKITVGQGESFLDKMISLVEGASRQKTPNEIALCIFLASLTILFLIVTATLLPFSAFSVSMGGKGATVSVTVLVSLMICLAPTTIGALLSAIGIAGIDRLLRKNVLALSGRAVEAVGDIDVLLLDKTGTITLGNREAVAFYPINNNFLQRLCEVAMLSSLSDETPEGKSVIRLAEKLLENPKKKIPEGSVAVAFSAHTRMSGIDMPDCIIRKGASSAVKTHIENLGGSWNSNIDSLVMNVAKRGATPLVVSEGKIVLGVIELKDIVKTGMLERFSELRRMGIKTVMITGDNPLTAASIAAEVGVDDFLAEATPETKLNLIREYQRGGRLVAMTGDGTNDAPALAQSDVAVVMSSGTQAAKDAGNMIDMDSDPTKLIEIIETGKQLLMTRGALTTFSVANDVAKYFAIIPAAFVSTYPELGKLNVMNLESPESAILSAVIFNAIIIVFLIPFALKGVKLKLKSASEVLRDNILIYGFGGLLIPFIGIKFIDVALTFIGFA